MLKQYQNPEEVISLLINLVKAEQEERKKIATDFHAKKSSLSLISWLLEAIEKDADAGKFNSGCTAEPMKILNDSMNEFRAVCYDIYPKIITYSGLHVGLRQIVKDSPNKYGIEVAYSTNLISEPDASKDKQVAIYRICLDLLEYFYHLGNTELGFDVSVNESTIELFMIGLKSNSNSEMNTDSAAKLMIFKGRLFCLQGIVHPETDWKHFFKFSFNLED